MSLVRALVLGTEVLLLGEPAANLDPGNMSTIEEAITHVNYEWGTPIVMAIHNMF